jgi:hypothetical protein
MGLGLLPSRNPCGLRSSANLPWPVVTDAGPDGTDAFTNGQPHNQARYGEVIASNFLLVNQMSRACRPLVAKTCSGRSFGANRRVGRRANVTVRPGL